MHMHRYSPSQQGGDLEQHQVELSSPQGYGHRYASGGCNRPDLMSLGSSNLFSICEPNLHPDGGTEDGA